MINTLRPTRCALVLFGMLAASSVMAKLPPANEEAKAKAAEAAAKAAHGNLVASFQLCKSMDRTAASYQAQAKKDGKELKPATTTPPCADPGPFVYPLPVAAAAPGAAPAGPAAAAAPAAAAKPAATVAATAAAPKK